MRTRMRLRALCAASALAATTLPLHAAPFAYITNQGSHDVSVIDLATDAVVATVPVGRGPAGAARRPTAMTTDEAIGCVTRSLT